MIRKYKTIIVDVSHEKTGSVGKFTAYGKSFAEWIGSAVKDDCTIISDNGETVSRLIRPYIDKLRDYTVVLYTDAPCVRRSTIESAVKKAETSGYNVLPLPRGYIFKTDYISNVDEIVSSAAPFSGDDFFVVDDMQKVAAAREILRTRIVNYHLDRGVDIFDPMTVYIDIDVVIESGVTIAPNNIIKGKTIIKKDAVIESGNVIDSCVIDECAKIDSSRLYSSYVGKNTTVGPFCYVRPDNIIGASCRIGDFVELKNSVIGDGCKVSHLTYVGDVQMGKECNIGCGVVFVNYDGKNKFKSLVGDRVFVGSNSNIVAPVKIDGGAFIAAGSTITGDVPADALAIARARQQVKEHWQGNKYKK